MQKSSQLVLALTLTISANASANWGTPAPMMPFDTQAFTQQMQPFGPSMPWDMQSYNNQRYQPRYIPYNRTNRYNRNYSNRYNRGYQAPQAQPFGDMGMGMMPFNALTQPQAQYQAPQAPSFMMPGMDQGIRAMMEPGKIMAEEATPGGYMKPTWR